MNDDMSFITCCFGGHVYIEVVEIFIEQTMSYEESKKLIIVNIFN